jgi:hypothetical protein
MGATRYGQAQMLIHNVRTEKQNLVAARLQCSAAAASYCGHPMSFHKSMPSSVRDSYFETTTLLNAFEKIPSHRLDKIDWKGFLDCCEIILQTYQEWMHSIV